METTYANVPIGENSPKITYTNRTRSLKLANMSFLLNGNSRSDLETKKVSQSDNDMRVRVCAHVRAVKFSHKNVLIKVLNREVPVHRSKTKPFLSQDGPPVE